MKEAPGRRARRRSRALSRASPPVPPEAPRGRPPAAPAPPPRSPAPTVYASPPSVRAVIHSEEDGQELLMDLIHQRTLLELNQKVHPKLQVVGWFSTYPTVVTADNLFHSFFLQTYQSVSPRDRDARPRAARPGGAPRGGAMTIVCLVRLRASRLTIDAKALKLNYHTPPIA